MSSNQYGLPFTAPSTQTLLPIIMPSGRIYGFFPITQTTFAGTETTFELTEGPVPITTVTLPPKVSNNTYDEGRITQYMAAQWPADEEEQEPWIGYSELVSVNVPNNIGYYSWWSMPVTMWFHHFGRGQLWNSLMFNLSKYVTAPAGSPNPPDVTTPQTLYWATTQNLQAFSTECSFFDFNWVTLFETQYPADPSLQSNAAVPLSIATTSNPTGGFFKASVLTIQGSQVIIPGGGAVNNTVRILRLQDPVAGEYVFDFTITANIGGDVVTVPVVLTLTVA